MIKKSIFSLIFIFLLPLMVIGQETTASKVDGLELPPDQIVSPDEGFISIQAKCKGDVKWLVISGNKVKFVAIPTTNTIIVSVPPQGVVSVFAVGLVDGKITEFARTNINIGNNPTPQPNPTPPTPIPVAGPFHVTLLIDAASTTADLAQLLNSPTLKQQITAQNAFFRVYDFKSPVVSQKKLDSIAAKIGGSAVLIIQRNDGFVLQAIPLPRTEAEILAIFNKSIGK